MVKIDDDGQLDDLIVSLEKLEPAYRVRAEPLLNKLGKKERDLTADNTEELHRVWAQRVKGELKRSWKFLPVKYYKGGTAAVIRVESNTSYSHLMENDHKVFTARRKNNKLGKKVARAKTADIQAARVKYHGVREGDKMLANAQQRIDAELESEISKLFDEITAEFN